MALKTWERLEERALLFLTWYATSLTDLKVILLLQASELPAHLLLQSQELYTERFRNSGTGNSATNHLNHLEASAEAIDDDGASSCCNLSGEVATSCADIKGEEESVRLESCSNTEQPVLKPPRSEIDENCQSSPPENLVESVSSSTLGMENGKEEKTKSSQTLNGS